MCVSVCVCVCVCVCVKLPAYYIVHIAFINAFQVQHQKPFIQLSSILEGGHLIYKTNCEMASMVFARSSENQFIFKNH